MQCLNISIHSLILFQILSRALRNAVNLETPEVSM